MSADPLPPIWRCEYTSPRDGARCTGEQLNTSDFCVLHAPAAELDLSAFHAGRLRAARYKLADALPRAAEEMVNVLSNDGETASTRLKAAAEILDRAGIPRAAAVQTTTDLTVRVEKTAGQILAERLAALAGRSADASPYVIDATPDPEDATLPEPPLLATAEAAL